ncbi:MAG: NADH:flavin oxidoreductase [Proteobacteria bacterium]|jgi:2,4-dienoyl-CoA reductase-like NADH-dependent reductase (Old Yellow Enzyme family)|nr:NADH:flavin oxidoreductase [Pseudomonadota bacterium]
MWRPAQKIKWKPAPGRWPTAGEAAGSRLFGPIGVGALHLATRTWVPAMVPWRATEDGFVTQDNIDWYARFAAGRPGAIVVEATGIRDVPSGPLLRIGHERFVPGLRKIVDAVHEASAGETKVFIQIIDFLAIRRRPEPARYLGQHLRITERHRSALGLVGAGEADVRARLLQLGDAELDAVLDARELEALRMGARERVTDLHLAHIRELPQVLPDLFAGAARRAREAGFDGIELHYAHAYTMASFLSAANARDDGYGGTRAGRLRLPLEVYRRVREAVGEDYVVGCRFLADECIAGGSTVDDAAHYGVAFARAGMDFLSMSRGGKFDDAQQPAIGWSAYPYTGPSGYECMPHHVSDERGPFGRNIDATVQVRRAIRAQGLATPVVLTGGMHGFGQAEALLASGQADVIGFARQSLADPDWFVKVRSGHGDAVGVCIYANYCEALDEKHEEVTCQIWDRVALDEPGIRKSRDGKRRLLPPPWRPPH